VETKIPLLNKGNKNNLLGFEGKCTDPFMLNFIV
jgi:hypothetical protein